MPWLSRSPMAWKSSMPERRRNRLACSRNIDRTAAARSEENPGSALPDTARTLTGTPSPGLQQTAALAPATAAKRFQASTRTADGNGSVAADADHRVRRAAAANRYECGMRLRGTQVLAQDTQF